MAEKPSSDRMDLQIEYVVFVPEGLCAILIEKKESKYD